MLDFALNYVTRVKLVIAFFTLLIVVNVIDIYDDLLENSSLTHILEESFMILVFLGVIAYLTKRLIASARHVKALKVELSNIKKLHAQQTEKMQQARKDYSEIIREQFEQWQLTKSEMEVGFLLLKGLSLKEIADIRDIKEKSTRQQASNIYAKANVAGRHEFAGWFFEDLT